MIRTSPFDTINTNNTNNTDFHLRINDPLLSCSICDLAYGCQNFVK